MKGTKIVWQIDLSQLIGRRITVETREGLIRTGTLTEIRHGQTEIIGNIVEFPTNLILDNDDDLPFVQVRHVVIAR